MKIHSVIVILLLNFLITGFVYAGEYDNTSREWQIKTYSSAAPDFIGNFATIIGANGKVLREGSNGWVCLAFNPMPEGGFNSPHDANPACGDAASLAWVDAYMNNTIPEMESDGWLWMLHGDTGVDNFRAYSEGEIERVLILCTSLSQVLT